MDLRSPDDQVGQTRTLDEAKRFRDNRPAEVTIDEEDGRYRDRQRSREVGCDG